MENMYNLGSFQVEGRDSVEIRDIRVYDLKACVIKSNNPMITEPRDCSEEVTEKDLKRAIKLGNCTPGSGHDVYLSGIKVAFDVHFTQAVWQQIKRYHWFDFISSCSTMHRITAMGGQGQKCDCSRLAYVLDRYNETTEYPTKLVINNDLVTINSKSEMFEELVKSIPSGFRLWGSISTNYLQLKTIHAQRKKHKLSDQRDFAAFIESLPYSELFINTKSEK